MKQETPKQHVELINDNIEEFDKAIELFKQETLEEASFRLYPENEQWTDRHIFTLGAKWQQERSYSEEEVLDILYRFHYDLVNSNFDTKEEWFEQFKKK